MATPQEAQALNLVQLYQWGNADDMIQSQYGHVKISEWIQREQTRIAKDPTRQAIAVTHGHQMTLFVDDVSVKIR